MLLCLRLREPENTPYDLLDSRGRARLLETAQHVGEWAVPSLAQLLHGNDKAHRALRCSDVLHVLQLVELADRNLYLVFPDAELAHQTFTQRLARIHTLRLEQQNGSQILARLLRLSRRELFEVGAQGDGFGEQLVALARVPRDDAQRQFYHVRRFQLRCRDVMQHVRRVLRPRGRGGELDDARRQYVAERGEGKVGARVVRLVYDDNGPAQPQHVHQ